MPWGRAASAGQGGAMQVYLRQQKKPGKNISLFGKELKGPWLGRGLPLVDNFWFSQHGYYYVK